MEYQSFDELEDAIDEGVSVEISTRTIDQWREDLITQQLVSHRTGNSFAPTDR